MRSRGRRSCYIPAESPGVLTPSCDAQAFTAASTAGRFCISDSTIADTEAPGVGSLMPCDCRHWSNAKPRLALLFELVGLLLPPHPATAKVVTDANARATPRAWYLLILDPMLLLPLGSKPAVALHCSRGTLSRIRRSVGIAGDARADVDPATCPTAQQETSRCALIYRPTITPTDVTTNRDILTQCLRSLQRWPSAACPPA
jgi:hypothetical protein